METDRIDTGGPVFEKTALHALHEDSFYDASESLGVDEGESDLSPHPATKDPCSSDDSPAAAASEEKTQNVRTPRIQRMKANGGTAKSKKKSTTFGLTFRSGTKESIDRSTCSTVVGSTHGGDSCHRRVRQGSDLSALSHCSEVSESRHDQGDSSK